MAINFDSFTEGTTSTIQSNDYVVGFDTAVPGGERKYTVSTLANAVSGVMSTELNNKFGGGGTVTNVTGTAPISVANGTTTPAISIAAATTTGVGVAELATLAEVQGGIGTNTIVTPANLNTLLNTLSTNIMNTVGKYPYLEYAWVTAPNAAGQTLTANTSAVLTLNTEVADTGNFGSLNSNQITLAAGTYQYEASVRVVNTAPDSAASILQLINVSDGSFVSRTSDNDSTGAYMVCTLKGQFTIASSKTFLLALININQSGSSVIRSGTWGTSFTNSSANADQRTTIKLWKVG